jgi:MFS family permease
MLFMGILLARFSGKGSLDLSASTLAPQWFIERRAFSIMLVGLGGTAGGVIFPLLNTYLINTYGWREAYRILAGGLWLIFIPIALVFLISRPEDAGLFPDNKRAPADESDQNTPRSQIFVDDEVSLTHNQALRSSAFWIVALSVFQASMIGTGITLQFVSIFRESGFSMNFAAQILSLKTFIALATVVLMGLVLDKIKRQHFVLALASLLQAIGFILLTQLKNLPMAYIYTLVSGFSGALMGISVGVLKPNLFGRRYLGGILGVLMAINVIGSAIGPFVYGAAFDIFQGYREIILISTILPFATAVLSLKIRKPEIQLTVDS